MLLCLSLLGRRLLLAVLLAALAACASTIKPTAKQTLRDPLSEGGLGPLMVWLDGTLLRIGSPPSERARNADERQRDVRVGGFYIGKYEVTFAQYDRFARATGRVLPDDSGWGRGDRPVINVSWYDAHAYTLWLSQQTGQFYRLPTEAEWEYAARAGTNSAYWWGDDMIAYANCFDCPASAAGPGSFTDNGEQTAPVGSFPANGFALHDTAGNVWEWTCSAYEAAFGDAATSCINPDDPAKRVLRGGSWISMAHTLRSAFRAKNTASTVYRAFGFRVVRAIR